MYKGDRKVTMEKLRLPTEIEVQHGNMQFYTGCFMGSTILLTFILIYYYAAQYSNISPKPNDMREMFMYRLMLFPILMFILIAWNLRIWSSVGVNYVFIFDLDVRRHMTKWEFLLVRLVQQQQHSKPHTIRCFFFHFFYTHFTRVRTHNIDSINSVQFMGHQLLHFHVDSLQ